MNRLLKALLNSIAGLRAAYQGEAAFRQECLLTIILTPLPFVLQTTNTEKVLLIGSLLMLLIVEILNSAIEAVVDRVGLERHELSGRAKDLGSAAVLLALICCSLTWTLILLVPET